MTFKAFQTPDLLAFAFYGDIGPLVDYDTASAVLVPVDPSFVVGPFTAPANGIILATLEAPVTHFTGVDWTTWALFDAATNTLVGTDYGVIATNSATQRTRVTLNFPVVLNPYQQYTLRWAHATPGGTARLTAGGIAGAAFMYIRTFFI